MESGILITTSCTFPYSLLAAAPGDNWNGLLEILLLLGAAMILGMLAERLRQSAIVGYLLAGTLIGPGAFGLVTNQQDIFNIAELGVALLLFAIGLEFSPKRLMSLGKLPLIAGPIQVVLTLVVGAAVSRLLGIEFVAAIIIGAMIALSSTACVLRILKDRTEIDSPYGRISLGILLMQDVAFVPLLLLVTILTTGGTVTTMLWQLALSIVSASLLIAVFYGLFKFVTPKILELKTWRRNRDLPILLAVVMALGSAWVAHRVGLSPAMGAFVAGVLLAVSPFSVQIRADIEPIKTVLITLFFASVGMFGDLIWLFQNLGLVCGVVSAIVLGKGALIAIVVRLSGGRTQFAVGSAFCLAQVGEFSFVLATVARGDGAEGSILSETLFRAIVSATMVSLLITPYLIAIAPHAGAWVERCLSHLFKRKSSDLEQRVKQSDEEPAKRDLIFIIGYGPAGQRVSDDLISQYREQLVVIDTNPDNIKIAQKRYGLVAHIGDATQIENLEHAGIQRANLVIITVPSLITCRNLVYLARHHTSDAIVFARARYHVHLSQLVQAGAHVVVDEEDQVGHELAAKVLAELEKPEVD